MDFLTRVGRREEVETTVAGRWVELENKSLNGYERNMLYVNLGAAGDESVDGEAVPRMRDRGFVEGVDLIEDGRAAVTTDVDGDGDLDLVVQNFGRQARVLLNRTSEKAASGGAPRHWLQVKLDGPAGNRDALGAVVVVRLADGTELRREVTSSSGYLAGQSTTLSFGLGDAEAVEGVRVVWPDGTASEYGPFDADQKLVLAPIPPRS